MHRAHRWHESRDRADSVRIRERGEEDVTDVEISWRMECAYVLVLDQCYGRSSAASTMLVSGSKYILEPEGLEQGLWSRGKL